MIGRGRRRVVRVEDRFILTRLATIAVEPFEALAWSMMGRKRLELHRLTQNLTLEPITNNQVWLRP
jgi:hypothetical protein